MAPTMWTILALLRWADERFRREGMATPRLDAELLLAETLGLDRVGLYTHFDQPLQPGELARFKELIRRRLRRERVAYILGKREFWSLPLRVTPEVLIPRPDTETLVSEGLKVLAPLEGKEFRFLEIGTGSGAVSIALAKELPGARGLATDLSPRALAIAQENAREWGVRERLRFVQGDLFEPLKQGEVFDLIVTNPPYIPREDFPSLPPEVREYEPRIALDGGDDGLDFYRRALPGISDYLTAGGWFLAEIGAGQGPKVLEMGRNNPSLDSFGFAKDLSGIDRVFRVRKKT